MPEHITLDTALAEAEFALNKALQTFVCNLPTHQFMESALTNVRLARRQVTPGYRW